MHLVVVMMSMISGICRPGANRGRSAESCPIDQDSAPPDTAHFCPRLLVQELQEMGDLGGLAWEGFSVWSKCPAIREGKDRTTEFLLCHLKPSRPGYTCLHIDT